MKYPYKLLKLKITSVYLYIYVYRHTPHGPRRVHIQVFIYMILYFYPG